MENKRIINVISNTDYESRKTLQKLICKLKKAGFSPSETFDNNAELNICIGGDGAFLRAIHRSGFSEIPFVGINTGHLGFFQELLPNQIDAFILKYINKDYKIENIFMVNADICTKDKCFNLTGINEIVIKGTHSKVVHLEVFINNNHLQRFSGDGLIVSTPSGSTAYNFSSGGSIVYPSLESLQITPLSPINSSAYRSLPNSVLTPGDAIIKIKPEYRYENSILIMNDGMEFRYDNIESIDLSISNKKLYKLSFNEDSYWNNLKSKFL